MAKKTTGIVVGMVLALTGLVLSILFLYMCLIGYTTYLAATIIYIVFILIFFILGVLIIVKAVKNPNNAKSEAMSMKQCPSCQKHLVWENARFCSACGADINPQCSQCNIPLRIGDAFCYKCGQGLAKNTPPILSAVSQSSIPTTVKANTRCPYCKAIATTHDAFCGTCGTSFAPMATDKTSLGEQQ